MSPASERSGSTSLTLCRMRSSIRRVAITGAAGYVAGMLMERLEREAGIDQVLALDVRPLRTQQLSKVVFRQHDVTTPLVDLLAEHKIDAIAHLAYVLRPGHDRAAIERINVGGAINVLEACEQAGVKHLLYLSSTSVYGAHADNPPLLTEDSPARPVPGFQYSEDKASVESLITKFTKRHPETTAVVLRTCPVMGPNADNFIAGAFSKPVLVGVRGCDPPMQFLHEDDLADALSHCLLQQVSGVYNLTGDGTIRWSEMAELFDKRLVFLPAPILYGLTSLTWTLRLQRDSPSCGLNFIRHRWTASNEKLKRELGIRLRYSSREAWEAFVQRDRKHSHARM